MDLKREKIEKETYKASHLVDEFDKIGGFTNLVLFIENSKFCCGLLILSLPSNS